jgi:murein DD-endopeptidase MepM/ murein hydrolase activator NlpD
MWVGRCAAVLAVCLALLGGAGTTGAGAQETGAVRPVPGPVVTPFVPPRDAYGPGHRGVDLAAAPGEEVRAALAGTVAFAGQVAGQGWVTLDHGGGLQTTYGVLAAGVRQAQSVAAGAVLGTVAQGRAHLDWGAKLDGAYLDPLTLLVRRRAHLVDPGTLRARSAGPALPAPALPGPDRPAPGRLAWPVPGRITSGFGPRTHPLHGDRGMHSGVDIAAARGTPIVAAADGLVTIAGPSGGYGLMVEVDHGGGLSTRYAHASELLVRPGDSVRQGQPLALVGSTGASTGPHLHFEVRVDGQAQDPLRWFPP